MCVCMSVFLLQVTFSHPFFGTMEASSCLALFQLRLTQSGGVLVVVIFKIFFLVGVATDVILIICGYSATLD